MPRNKTRDTPSLSAAGLGQCIAGVCSALVVLSF